MKFNKDQINGVLFKLDNNDTIYIDKINGEWIWDKFRKLNNEHFQDLSAINPFEFVFCCSEGGDIHTENCKTTIENTSFLKLYDAGLLKKWIDLDYRMQYEGLTRKIENGEDGWITERYEKNKQGEWNKI